MRFSGRGCSVLTGRETGCTVFSSGSSLQNPYTSSSARIFYGWFGGYAERRCGRYRRGVLFQAALHCTGLKLGKRKGFFIS
jgi:hypothetical protein